MAATAKPMHHVALSFAGEDRDFVEKVATQLRSDGVNVFYDKYEEVDLWGKDLYVHLKDVYEKSALFTVMFISEHYWTSFGPIMNARPRKSEHSRKLGRNTSFPRFSTRQSRFPVWRRRPATFRLRRTRASKSPI
jgi:hypothetical protein